MRAHYEKIITVCCFLVLFVNIGFPSTSFNVYQPYIVQLPGVGDSGGSLVLSTRTLVTFFVLFFVDHYYEKLDVRLGATLAMLLTAGGFVLYGLANSLPVLIAGAVVAGSGYGLGGYVVVTLLTNRWYRDGIGAAIGFATIGSGVAGFVVPLVAVRLVEGISLQVSFFVQAATAAALAALVFAFVRNEPADVGLEPYEAKPKEGKAARTKSGHPIGATKIERGFALLACGLVGSCAIGAGAYLSILFVTNGIDPNISATLLAVLAVCLIFAKYFIGELFDRVGTAAGSALALASLFVGMACCCLVGIGGVVAASVAAVFLGMGQSIGSVGISVWSLEFADPENTARSVKNAQLAYSAGGFVSNTFPGFIKELTGTYLTTYVVLLVLVVVTAVIVLSIYRRHRV